MPLSDLGGRDHLDVTVWEDIKPSGARASRSIRSLKCSNQRVNSLLMHEEVKAKILCAAVEAIQGTRPLDDPHLLYGDIQASIMPRLP